MACRNCGQGWHAFEEKMTDVNIATELLVDSFQKRFDTALLISADSDLIGPVSRIKEIFPHKRIIVFFPPSRSSANLKAAANVQLSLGHGLPAKSQFPDTVTKPDGFILKRPAQWK